MNWYCVDSSRNLILKLYVQPGARQTKIVDVHGEELKIKLAAPPVEGKANHALTEFLAKCFNVPLKHVILKRGAQSRHKIVEICQPGNDPDVLLGEMKIK